MKSIEIEGKTVEEALNKALSELKTVKEMVNVEVIDQGSKGLFNVIGVKPAIREKIKVNKQPPPPPAPPPLRTQKQSPATRTHSCIY